MVKDVLSLAWEDMRRKNFATAIKRLESKADIYQNNFEYYITLGIACLYIGDIGSASSYFQLARRIRLTDTRLLLGQAAIFLRRGDTARALEYYLEIKSNDPGNKTADQAMEFIRLHGDYDTICRWVDTGRIEQFYPPIKFYSNQRAAFLIPVGACLLGVGLILFVAGVSGHRKPVSQERRDLSSLELTVEEETEAKEKDLSSQSFKYILSNKEITKKYNDALTHFQNHRDNAAQIDVNAILNSDASSAIKQKASILTDYFEIPNFDNIKDVPSFASVMSEKELYLDCWVDWGGKVSNAKTFENGVYSCDLLVGDENLEHFDGTIKVYFDRTPIIEPSQYVRLLGRIAIDKNGVYLKGRSVYQSIYK